MPTFKLTVDDALALAAAISDDQKPSEVVLPSTGQRLKIFVSKNGCRRVDVTVAVPGATRRHAWMKLMAQNVHKGSAAAARARRGARIVHILPLDAAGKHSNGPGWGMVEDGALVKNSSAAIDAASWAAYRKRSTARPAGAASSADAPAGKKRRTTASPPPDDHVVDLTASPPRAADNQIVDLTRPG